ncbi:2,3,4,5-tetrahydropyridine-2,6-dicarboxylate N-acetyltransferase [Rubripirellula amarantea]|uniref:2,3,4,5-tetrahydropyridine-2,6-dicarboxylate N-acetyltransferase n=1 Tax=Rubripirellula amarantea TaxID=2527999 RepID=A0A5C5WUW7_9BACT|nr:gamma carbonic anhydrase family protein [Rubripirellula amarantea]TWT54049.1 2,3,4,5-tetrahydropyridine-2,6-dicarboxylate N-acetyltransferase [Rubripirellula amarantea]
MKLNLEPLRNLDPSIFIAPNATVFGDVQIGREATIWFGAVIRGDTDTIKIGTQTNIQDLCVLHADPTFPCTIGDRVTVGHAAVIHGATIENDVLVGMRAVVLNGATIGTGSVIAAGTLIPENMVVPPNSLVMGVPGKVRGQTSEVHQAMITRGAKHYAEAGRQYLAAQTTQTK